MSSPRVSSPRRPGLVVAGRLWAPPLRQGRASGPVRARRTRQIGPMRLPPGARNDLLLRRGNVHRMMQPAMPRRRNRRGLGHTVVDHPAPLETKVRVDFAAARAEVAIAELVLADELAIEAGPDLRAEGPAVPPREEALQEIHRARHGTLLTRCPGPAQRLSPPCVLLAKRRTEGEGRRIAPHTGRPMLGREPSPKKRRQRS